MFVYRPLGRDYGDLRWTRTNSLSQQTGSVSYLSWGSSDELLVAAQHLSLWTFTNEHDAQLIWTSKVSSPIMIAAFSPDGGLVASCGHHDRVVKIWRRLSYEQDSTRFDVSYLSHPSTVTNLSWRCLWHQEQNLDNLLYTFCADKHVRVWAHSDPHASCALQKVVTIDTTASIQPRRMSMGSVSKNRFSFIIQSKDVARAAERALQTRRNATDHALEHLIEVANRSPEVCIVLDGLGHMSAWGIENAGLKNKLATDKFNVALVDGVNVALNANTDTDDFHQIHAFANNDVSASLCILVHSYTGEINWYEGSFVSFFDTAAKSDRLHLRACWSGHASIVERLIPSHDGRSFMSVSAANRAILWSMSQSDALVRRSIIFAEDDILGAALLDDSRFAAILHSSSISIWDTQSLRAKNIGVTSITRRVMAIDVVQKTTLGNTYLKVYHDNHDVALYGLHLPSRQNRQERNGYQELVRCVRIIPGTELAVEATTNFFVVVKSSIDTGTTAITATDKGSVQCLLIGDITDVSLIARSCRLSTFTQTSQICAALDDDYIALVHADGNTLSIWNLSQNSNEYTSTFSHLDGIKALHWQRSEWGQALLAVQSTFSIAILAQCRYGNQATSKAWSLYNTIATRDVSRLAITTCCWHAGDRLAVGLGNQIVTLDIDDDHNDVKEDASSKTSVLARLQLRNSSLHLFAPATLHRLLQQGDFVNFEKVCGILYDQLRFLTQDELVEINQPLALDLIIYGEDVLRSNALRNDDHNFELANSKERLQEGILKISTEQLNQKEKSSLRDIVDIGVAVNDTKDSFDLFSQMYFSQFLMALSNSTASKGVLEALPYASIVQASQSATQEALLNHVLGKLEEHGYKLTWDVTRALGLLLWLSDKDILAQQFEAVARNEYNSDPDNRNPVDCTLYYLALDKKAILISLWRRTIGIKEKEATMKLLGHNFQEQRWKASALKNAYALLSRRRFEYAASFFLLGGSLADAVNVCINQMHDLQLAIAIARVWTGDEKVQVGVVQKILSNAIPFWCVDTHEARWLLIWAAVQSESWAQAISYIVEPLDYLLEKQFLDRANSRDETPQGNSKLQFEALSYMSNEPTLLVKSYERFRDILIRKGEWTKEVLTPSEEWRFVMRCVNWYLRAGLDWLALELVANWKFVSWQEPKSELERPMAKQNVAPAEVPQKNMLDDWLSTDGPNDVVNGRNNHSDLPAPAEVKSKPKPPPTQFVEPTADSLLDSFGF